jgi:hypothetical protein
MEAIRKTAALAMLVMLFFSCTVYRQFPIEVLRTEEVKLDRSKPRIAFVYRNFKYNTDTLQLHYLENNTLITDTKNSEREVDSLLATSCLQNAATVLKENGICDDPVFYPYNIFPRQTGERIVPLPDYLIKKMAMPARADYLVVLETFSAFFTRFKNTEEYGNFEQVKAVAVWNLYNAGSGKVEDHKSMADTLSWDGNETDDGKAPRLLPPRLPALQQAAGLFGENYGKRFCREWIKVDRMIIIPPLEDFRIAADYADRQEWDKADPIWQKYTDQRFGRLAASACYDLALSREIRDDLTEALLWIGKAAQIAGAYKNSDEMKLTSQYQSILKERIKQINSAGRMSTPLKTE